MRRWSRIWGSKINQISKTKMWHPLVINKLGRLRAYTIGLRKAGSVFAWPPAHKSPAATKIWRLRVIIIIIIIIIVTNNIIAIVIISIIRKRQVKKMISQRATGISRWLLPCLRFARLLLAPMLVRKLLSCGSEGGATGTLPARIKLIDGREENWFYRLTQL